MSAVLRLQFSRLLVRINQRWEKELPKTLERVSTDVRNISSSVGSASIRN